MVAARTRPASRSRSDLFADEERRKGRRPGGREGDATDGEGTNNQRRKKRRDRERKEGKDGRPLSATGLVARASKRRLRKSDYNPLRPSARQLINERKGFTGVRPAVRLSYLAAAGTSHLTWRTTSVKCRQFKSG